MIKVIIALFCLGAVLLLGMFLGFQKGSNSYLVMEIKVLREMLASDSLPHSTQSPYREFLLARYYRLIGRLNVKQGSELAYDFGPVNIEQLSGISIDKEPGSSKEDYERIKNLIK